MPIRETHNFLLRRYPNVEIRWRENPILPTKNMGLFDGPSGMSAVFHWRRVDRLDSADFGKLIVDGSFGSCRDELDKVLSLHRDGRTRGQIFLAGNFQSEEHKAERLNYIDDFGLDLVQAIERIAFSTLSMLIDREPGLGANDLDIEEVGVALIATVERFAFALWSRRIRPHIWHEPPAGSARASEWTFLQSVRDACDVEMKADSIDVFCEDLTDLIENRVSAALNALTNTEFNRTALR